MTQDEPERDLSQQTDSGDTAKSFVDTSPFVELLSAKSRVDITDALIRNPGLTLTASEISELAGRHPSSFHRHKDILEEFQILEPTRDVSGTQLYKLNESKVAYHLREAQAALIEQGSTVNDVQKNLNEEVDEQKREKKPPEPDLDVDDAAEGSRQELQLLEK